MGDGVDRKITMSFDSVHLKGGSILNLIRTFIGSIYLLSKISTFNFHFQISRSVNFKIGFQKSSYPQNDYEVGILSPDMSQTISKFQ